MPADLDGKPLVIEKGQANYAYDRLFGGCMEGAAEIIVEEPFMDMGHYGKTSALKVRATGRQNSATEVCCIFGRGGAAGHSGRRPKASL